ncbi:MAG: glutamine synthetase family protein [Coriobacteriia bacterium]|nr:glutamine synthetase family protein [Coriobacteriia bacterium]
MKGVHDKASVLKAIEEQDIHFIKFWFTDVLGNLKAFELTKEQIETAFDEGMGFDGSSIQGFARIEESDMIAYPDPESFMVLPGDSCGKKSAAIFCNIANPDGTPYQGDPRQALKRVLKKAYDMGFTFNIGPELEFYYFTNPYTTELIDFGGYFDMAPEATEVRRATVLALQEAGITVEFSHHEVGNSQHEIDLRYQEALKMADIVMAYRLLVKEVASDYGVYASFMPKPISGAPGNGMHVNQSLFDQDGNNVFYDENDEKGYYLSDLAQHYIAGLLKYAPEFCAITNPNINSYKRLVTGFEAPVYVTWARRNRSALVRIPLYKPGKGKATRVEMRNPDPSCNPYLVFAVMLAAGLKGVEDKLELPKEVSDDVFSYSDEQLLEAGIQTLPGDLSRAIDLFEESDLMREALGEHIHEYFVRNKRAEWNEYRSHVTQWELERYLPIL